MKERPIIFSTEMVKAILDGRKTQTRRVVKPQPILRISDECFKRNMAKFDFKCPYGQVGDRLWVRETAWYGPQEKRVEFIPSGNKGAQENATFYGAKKKPSIFMPRWASRVTLEIIEVRVERLQEITEEDAVAEGESWSPVDSGENPEIISAKENYAHLWDSLNAKRGYPFDFNPWVWVIKFDNIGVRVK